MSALMDNLNLPNPKMMDVAVPANMKVGLAQQDDRAPRLGAYGRRHRARPRSARPDATPLSICAKTVSESEHGSYSGLAARALPATCMANIHPGRRCCTALARSGDEKYCCSTVRSASARRWRYERPMQPDITSACHFERRHRRVEKSRRPCQQIAAPGYLRNLAEEHLGPLMLRIARRTPPAR